MLIGASVLLFNLWQGSVKREVTCKAEHTSYVAQEAKLGADAERRKEESDRDNRIIFAKQARIVRSLTQRALFAERELLKRPPVRPDGSSVSISTCNSEGASAAVGELVPLEEYRALEGRALRDTDRCTALQSAVAELAAKGLLRLE